MKIQPDLGAVASTHHIAQRIKSPQTRTRKSITVWQSLDRKSSDGARLKQPLTQYLSVRTTIQRDGPPENLRTVPTYSRICMPSVSRESKEVVTRLARQKFPDALHRVHQLLIRIRDAEPQITVAIRAERCA